MVQSVLFTGIVLPGVAMIDFLQGKRREFVRCLRRFVVVVTAVYLVLLYLGAAA